MANENAIYAVARVRSHERMLINAERMRRIAEAAPQEALRQVLDAGYGAMPDAKLEDVETLVENERRAAVALIKEISPDKTLTDIFLMKADIHNLKLLLKLRLLNSNEKAALMAGGVYETAALEAMLEQGDYSQLPEAIASALKALEKSFVQNEGRGDPVRVSTALDEAYILYALSLKDKFATEYFTAYADFTNVAAVLRTRALKKGEEGVKPLIVDGGEIKREKLIEAAKESTSFDELYKLLLDGQTRDAVKKALERIALGAGVSAIERERDNYLIKLASRGKNEYDSVAPIIGYLLAREQEGRSVRLILTLKRNGLDESAIEERLRELYG